MSGTWRRRVLRVADASGVRWAWRRGKATAKLLRLLPRLQEPVRLGLPALIVDYDLDLTPRWSESRPLRSVLDLIEPGRQRYRETLGSFVGYADQLARVSVAPAEAGQPSWLNGWMMPLDSIALYSLVAQRQPRLYVEIGSGETTKFVRRAITDHDLPTRVISIDPEPRSEIDALCDEVIRHPLERVDHAFWSRLGADCVLFLDGSHRCLTNSDVTAFFLEILPAVPAGCLIGVHDIFLPYDYPPDFARRLYSEQYVLGTYLLGDAGRRVRIILPTAYAGTVGDSSECLRPLWDRLPDGLPHASAAAFWFQCGG